MENTGIKMYQDIYFETLENIKTDTFQYGLAMLLSQLVAGHSLFTDDCANTKTIILTLMGFAVFQIANGVYKVGNFGTDKIRSSFLRVTIEDTLKFGLALTFGNLTNPNGLRGYKKEFFVSTLHLLTGLALYNLIISKYLISLMIKPGMKLNHIMAVNNTFKFSFALLFSGMLNQLSDVGKVNFEYIRLTVGYVMGIVGYDLLFA